MFPDHFDHDWRAGSRDRVYDAIANLPAGRHRDPRAAGDRHARGASADRRRPTAGSTTSSWSPATTCANGSTAAVRSSIGYRALRDVMRAELTARQELAARAAIAVAASPMRAGRAADRCCPRPSTCPACRRRSGRIGCRGVHERHRDDDVGVVGALDRSSFLPTTTRYCTLIASPDVARRRRTGRSSSTRRDRPDERPGQHPVLPRVDAGQLVVVERRTTTGSSGRPAWRGPATTRSRAHR